MSQPENTVPPAEGSNPVPVDDATNTAASGSSTAVGGAKVTANTLPITIESHGQLPDDDAFISSHGIFAYPMPLGYKATRVLNVAGSTASSKKEKTPKDGADAGTAEESDNSANATEKAPQQSFLCTFEVKAGPLFVISVNSTSQSSHNQDEPLAPEGTPATPSVSTAAPRVYKAPTAAMAWKVAKQIHNLEGPNDGVVAFGFNNRALIEVIRKAATDANIVLTAAEEEAIGKADHNTTETHEHPESHDDGNDDKANNVASEKTKGDDPSGGLRRFLIAERKVAAMRLRAAANNPRTVAKKEKEAAAEAAKKAKAEEAEGKKAVAEAAKAAAKVAREAKATAGKSEDAPQETKKAPRKGPLKPKCPLCKLSTPFCAVNGQAHDFTEQTAEAEAVQEVKVKVQKVKEEPATEEDVSPTAATSKAPTKEKKAPGAKKSKVEKVEATVEGDADVNTTSIATEEVPATQQLEPSTTIGDFDTTKKKATTSAAEKTKGSLDTYVAPPPKPAVGDPISMTRVSRPKKAAATEDEDVVQEEVEAPTAAKIPRGKKSPVGAKRAATEDADVSNGAPTPKKAPKTEGSAAVKKPRGKAATAPRTDITDIATEDESSVAIMPPSHSQTILSKRKAGSKRGRSACTTTQDDDDDSVTEFVADTTNASVKLLTNAEPETKKATKERKAPVPRTSIKTTVMREVVEADGTVTTIIEEIITPVIPRASKPAAPSPVVLDENGNPITTKPKRQIQTKLSFKPEEKIPQLDADGNVITGEDGLPVMIAKPIFIPPPPPPTLRAPFNKSQTKLAHDIYMKRGGLHSEQQLTAAGITASGPKGRFMRFIFQYSSERCRAELVRAVMAENNGQLPEEFLPKKASASGDSAGDETAKKDGRFSKKAVVEGAASASSAVCEAVTASSARFIDAATLAAVHDVTP